MKGAKPQALVPDGMTAVRHKARSLQARQEREAGELRSVIGRRWRRNRGAEDHAGHNSLC